MKLKVVDDLEPGDVILDPKGVITTVRVKRPSYGKSLCEIVTARYGIYVLARNQLITVFKNCGEAEKKEMEARNET